MKRKIPKGLRKHIRQEKAKIRREVLGIKRQQELIQEICPKILKDRKVDYEGKK